MDPTMAGNIAEGNRNIVCQYKDNVATFGIWISRNPLNFSLPLILLQLAAISLASLLIEIFLRPLGQSSIVAQILGGILFGPSVLGHDGIMGSILFPARSMLTLETVAVFGIMFFLFAIGLRTDTRMMVRLERQAVMLGFSAIFVTLVFSLWLTIFLANHVAMDKSLANALPFFGAASASPPSPTSRASSSSSRWPAPTSAASLAPRPCSRTSSGCASSSQWRACSNPCSMSRNRSSRSARPSSSSALWFSSLGLRSSSW